jgi:general secretion pathway protein A
MGSAAGADGTSPNRFSTIGPVTGPDNEHSSGYERFFGFHETPFSLAPDTRFRFQSASHAAALGSVTYALERREPVVVVTGEIGTGKTLLCRTVIEQSARKTFLSIINDPQLERDELLKRMLQDFGVISKDRTAMTPTTRHDLTHALQEFLSSLAPLKAHAAVIIDEAQHVHPDVLEQIRIVSNIQDERGTMLQIILVGQTDLEQLMARPELRQLAQRVARTVRLNPLSEAEVALYIDHRLAVARERPASSNIPGATELARELAEWDGTPSDRTFDPEAIRAVTRLSHGIPRVVNLLCDRALEAAYERQSRTVDVPAIDAAVAALGLAPAAGAPAAEAVVPASPMWSESVPTALPAEEPPPEPAARTGVGRLAIVAAAIVVVGAAIWFGTHSLNQGEQSVPGSSAPATNRPAPVPQTAPPAAAPTPDTIAPPPAATAPPTAPPAAARPAPPSSGASPTTGSFEIVVASFRTVQRATDVADAVQQLGEPVRQRSAGGWQQVLAGPYATSAQAEEAKQHLERGGFTGIHIVPVAR